MAEKYSTQIFRVDGKNCFLEVLSTCFSIGKILINMCSYDPNTHKEKQRLEFYLDFGDAIYLAEQIRSGRLDRTIAEAAKIGNFEGKPINEYTAYWSNMGGTKPSSAKHEKFREQFDWLTKGKCVSKILKIQKSTKYKYLIRGEYGLGNENEKGLIVPDGSPKSYIQVPFTERDALIFARILDIHIQAYYAQFYITYAGKLFPTQQCKVFEAATQNSGSTESGSEAKNTSSSASSQNKNRSTAVKAQTSQSNETQTGIDDDQMIRDAQSLKADQSANPTKKKETLKFQLRTISALKPMPKDPKSMCLQAVKEDGMTKNVVFLENIISAIEPEKWNRFKSGTSKGKVRVNILAVENSNGTLYFDKFA